MNVRLECFVSTTKGVSGYAIVKNGNTVLENIEKLNKGSDLKGSILDTVLSAVKVTKLKVSHDDTLTIIVQNVHIAEWLNTRESRNSNKRYSEKLDNIFDAIEELDCRYRIIYLDSFNVKKKISSNNYKISKELELESVNSLLDM